MTDDTSIAHIVIAEDDDDDYLLACEAMRDASLTHPVTRVCDGDQLLAKLREPGRDATSSRVLVLLDLNMPRKDGREALTEIRADPQLRRTPVVVMTTSTSEDDLANAYKLGVNSYINKPLTYGELVDTMVALRRYWLELTTLPPVAPPLATGA